MVLIVIVIVFVILVLLVFAIVCVCCLHISLSSDFELVVTPEYIMENLVNAGKQNP